MKNVKKERVDHHTYEGVCNMCGWPVYVGDYWYLDEETEEPCCSIRCVKHARLMNTFQPVIDGEGENWGVATIPLNWK